jgi:predicted ATPase
VLVEALLRACPDLHILATSREVLKLSGPSHRYRSPRRVIPSDREVRLTTRPSSYSSSVPSPPARVFT